MKTINIFTDYILIGTQTVLIILIPLAVCDVVDIYGLFKIDTTGKGLVLPLVAITLYLIGMVFNQLSDWFDTLKIANLYGLGDKITKIAKHHLKLQVVVANSRQAYEYLSYRRSIIRILRSLFLATQIAIVEYGVLLMTTGTSVALWDIIIFVSISILFTCFLSTRLVILYNGYNAAIVNFYESLPYDSKKINT